MALRHTAFISGHIPFSEQAFNEYRQEWSFVTILREPVSRWLSTYYYNRYKTQDHVKLSMALEEYLESPEGIRRGSAYVRFFSGTTEERPDIARAVDMMTRFSVIGTLEDLDGFSNLFRKRFGKQISIPHLNRTPAPESVRAGEITSQVKARVKEICEPDIEFYRSVLSRGGERSART